MRVPGPPRGRRRAVPVGVRERVAAMRQAESTAGGSGSLLRFFRDVILLLKDLAADPRVARGDKMVAVAAAAYLVTPVDLVTTKIPVVGMLDDLGMVAVALRRMLGAAGYEVIYELWRGSDEGLALVLALGGVER